MALLATACSAPSPAGPAAPPAGAGLPSGAPTSALLAGRQVLRVDLATGRQQTDPDVDVPAGAHVLTLLPRAGTTLALLGGDQGGTSLHRLGPSPGDLGPAQAVAAAAAPDRVWVERGGAAVLVVVADGSTLATVALAGDRMAGAVGDAVAVVGPDGSARLRRPGSSASEPETMGVATVVAGDGRVLLLTDGATCIEARCPVTVLGGGAGPGDAGLSVPPGLRPEAGGTVSPDGRTAAFFLRRVVGDQGRVLALADLATGTVTPTTVVQQGAGAAPPLAFSLDGRFLLHVVGVRGLAVLRVADGLDTAVPRPIPAATAVAPT